MAGFPEPEVGLVISYSYLWKEEEEQGLGEGRKDRPCGIVLTVEVPVPNLTAAGRSPSHRSRIHHPTTRMSRSKFHLASKSTCSSTANDPG